VTCMPHPVQRGGHLVEVDQRSALLADQCPEARGAVAEASAASDARSSFTVLLLAALLIFVLGSLLLSGLDPGLID
jgi:hypothetical protein